jgi:pimeloyl-ACP methyl ester carboxylesterase
MISTFTARPAARHHPELPRDGRARAPVLLFLHGFPEAAFVWDELLTALCAPENGGYRCVAPNLRGFEQSSAPGRCERLPPKHLVQDIAALIAAESPGGRSNAWWRTTGAAPWPGTWPTSSRS